MHIDLPSSLPDVGKRPVAVDCETSGLFVDDGARVASVGVAWYEDDGTISTGAFPFDQGRIGKPEGAQGSLLEVDHNLGEEEWLALLTWLADRRLLNQNDKFDAHHLNTGTRWWPGRELIDCFFWDTMLATKKLDPLDLTGLKPTAERRGLLDGGERDEEEVIKEHLKKNRLPRGRYDLIPWEIIGPYVAKDAVLALMLAFDQWTRIDQGESSYAAIDREFEVMKKLYLMEKRGVRYDVGASLEAAEVIESRMAELKEALPFEPGVNEAKRFFFSDDPGCLGGTPYAVTEKRAEPKLDDEIVIRMVTDGVKYAPEYQEWRRLDTAISMWYRGYPEMIGSDGRLRTSYRQTKVVSGRFSVERVQLQAIPHDHRLTRLPEGVPSVRKMFLPAEGCELWELDLSQAELRVAAKMADCVTMLKMIEEGQDLHSYVTTELFHKVPGDPDWFEYRQVGKRGDFSFIFGVGSDTFRATVRKLIGIDFSRDEASRLVDDWRAMFPEFQRQIYREDNLARNRGYVTLANGERRWFAPHEQTHKAFNQRVQGSLSELNKDWLVATEDAFPGTVLLSVHDSIALEIPLDRYDPVAVCEESRRIGIELAEAMFDVPFEMEFGRWGEK